LGIDKESLDEVAKVFAKATIEYGLRKTLDDVAGELPEEVLDTIYSRIYRPVMITVLKNLMVVMRNVIRSH
jgi:hypothetical protein